MRWEYHEGIILELLDMPNYETGGLSLETDAEAARRVQESSKVVNPTIEVPADLALQSEAQAAEDAAKAEAIVAGLKSENQKEMSPVDFDRAFALLGRLYADASTAEGQIDMGYGNVSPTARQGITQLKEMLSMVDQKKLAESFFGKTIGEDFNTHDAYQVYLALKGTEFSNTFKELESARLKEGGYGEFKI